MDRLRFISIKTQVRRLKYFSILLKLLNSKGTRRDSIERDLIFWSESNHSEFEKLLSASGEIVRSKTQKSSQSFSNYYEAIKKFNLIDEQNEFIIPSRIGSVFKALCSELNLKLSDDSYELNILERIFFIFSIFRSDADYFTTILESLNKYPEEHQDFYIRQFQTDYIIRLEMKINNELSSNKISVIENLNRVKKWRSPERYCEDIVPPRINWMIDLSLIDLKLYEKSRKLKLSSFGKCLLDNVHQNESKSQQYSEEWHNVSYLQIGLIVYRNIKTNWDDIHEEEKLTLADNLFEMAYKHFSVLGMPRISLEQSLLFSSLILYLTKDIIVGFKELSDWIGFEKQLKNYKIGIRNSARMYESYIFIERSFNENRNYN